MTTQPAPAERRPVTAATRRTWTSLTRMRTAIVLLLVLGAGSAVGSFFPQRPIDPRAVAGWIEARPRLTPVMEAFGLFDVYGAWWFMAIYGLLLVSLVGCLQRRYRAQVRAVRAHPRFPEDLGVRERYVRARITAPAADALEVAERALKRRRFSRAIDGGTIVGERGHLRESGSLLFHTSILIVLIGATIARMYGASGQVLLVEGDTFVDTPVAYDSIVTGRAFGARHTGFRMTLDEFTVEWHPSGIPRLFQSDVVVEDPDGSSTQASVRVNEPLTVAGRNVYQVAWGWAPVLEVHQDGRVLFDGPTVFLPEAEGWIGVAKIPQTTPKQTGLAMQLLVDPFEDEEGILRDRNREARAPVLVAQVLAGDLGLDRPQNVYRLEVEDLERTGQVIVGMGRTEALPNGATIRFADLVQYSVFQVGYNPGARVLLFGAIGLILGVVPGLYAFRRRLWIRATADDKGTILELAGHAFQRKTSADEEFADLVAELSQSLGTRVDAPNEQPTSTDDRSPTR